MVKVNRNCCYSQTSFTTDTKWAKAIPHNLTVSAFTEVEFKSIYMFLVFWGTSETVHNREVSILWRHP